MTPEPKLTPSQSVQHHLDAALNHILRAADSLQDERKKEAARIKMRLFLIHNELEGFVPLIKDDLKILYEE